MNNYDHTLQSPSSNNDMVRFPSPLKRNSNAVSGRKKTTSNHIKTFGRTPPSLPTNNFRSTLDELPEELDWDN